MVGTLDLLRQANNLLGGAAFKEVGNTSGRIPEVGSTNKLALSIMDSTNTGGSSSFSGKLAALDSSGKLAAAMLPSSGGGTGGGLKGLWAYNGRIGPGNTQGSSNSTLRQFSFVWTKPSDVNAILIIITGAGGSGAPGPDGLKNDGNDRDSNGNYHRGQRSRKGGGGAGGSTAIVYIGNVAASYNVKIGMGGETRPFGGTEVTKYNGGTSQFGNSIQARGGLTGSVNGDGGQPQIATPGNSDHGIGIRGGEGFDGSFDILGAGAGGGSWFGGAFSGGSGSGVNGRVASPGGGGGAGNGTPGNVQPGNDYTFNPRANGHPGADGALLVIGFG